MVTRAATVPLTEAELSAVTGYAVACAEQSLVLFVEASPQDPRPAGAIEAGRVVADGAARSRLQRTAAGGGRAGRRADAPASTACCGTRRPLPASSTTQGPFFHGTRADVRPGDLLTPEWLSNYGSGRRSRRLYVTTSPGRAPLAAELAQGDGPPRVYRVEPLGTLEDDPNVTDRRFPGNPTRPYRTREPLRVVEEVVGWQPPPAEIVARIRASEGQLAPLGIEAMD